MKYLLILLCSVGCSSLDYKGQESETKCFVSTVGKVNCIDRKLYNENYRR